MSLDPTTSSAGASLPPNSGANTPLKTGTTGQEPDKVTKVFKKALTPEEKEAKWKSDREFYIKDVMETKGVSRDVAEAEVNLFF